MSALRGTALGTVALPAEPERGLGADEAGNGSTGALGEGNGGGVRAKRALNGDSDDEVGKWSTCKGQWFISEWGSFFFVWMHTAHRYFT